MEYNFKAIEVLAFTSSSFFLQMSGLINSASGGQAQLHSPEHLVNRKDLLERMGLPAAGQPAKHSRGHPGSK